MYFAPRIPRKKLEAATGSYAGEVDADEVLVLIDATVFGGAKEGVVLIERGMYAKELMSAPARCEWVEVHQIVARGTVVWVNGHKFTDCTMVEKAEMRRLFQVTQEFVWLLQGERGLSAANAQAHTSRQAQPQESGSEEASPADRRAIFRIASEKLLDLCEFIEPIESGFGRQLADRDGAAAYFDVLAKTIEDEEVAQFAFLELGQIAVLCESALACGRNPGQEVAGVLLQDSGEDSPLVAELRDLLRALVHARAAQGQAARTRQFFTR